jgi:hypothetical protein
MHCTTISRCSFSPRARFASPAFISYPFGFTIYCIDGPVVHVNLSGLNGSVWNSLFELPGVCEPR